MRKSLILLALGALVLPACTTNGNFIRTEKVTAFNFHNSFLRRDVHADSVKTEGDDVELQLVGESKSVSGQAALAGAALGTALAGPAGGVVGGAAGVASDLATDKAVEETSDVVKDAVKDAVVDEAAGQ